MSKAKNNQDEQKKAQRLFSGFVNTSCNLQVHAGDKDANDGIHIEFLRTRGAQAWTKFDQMQTGVTALSDSQTGMTPIEGLRDKAYVLPVGIGVMVLKGAAFFGTTLFAGQARRRQ